MKSTIFAILILCLISCKKEDEPKPDNRTSGTLKVIYRSEDPTGMNAWLTTTDQFFFNTHRDTSEFIFSASIKTGQNIQGSVSSPNGYWKTLIVIFNSD